MKIKIIITVTAMSVISSGIFSSCNKDDDGIYNPEKKISKIYTQYDIGNKQLDEIWTWNKNQLSKIEYNAYSSVFEYEKNQISKITDNDGDYQKFTYNGSKISKIEYFSDYKLWIVFNFEHSKGKISKITIEENSNYGKHDLNFLKSKKNNALRLILPEQIAEKTVKANLNNQKIFGKYSEINKYTYTYTWKGDNVEQLVVEAICNGEVYTNTHKYTYDNKINPMYGLFIGEKFSLSKNNVIKSTETDNDNNYFKYECSYVYNDDFPTEIKYTYSIGVHIDIYTITKYYEYE